MKRLSTYLFLCFAASTLSAADLIDSVERYCIDCHNADKAKGELDLESILDDKISAHAATWEAVVRRLSAREMPPPGCGRAFATLRFAVPPAGDAPRQKHRTQLAAVY